MRWFGCLLGVGLLAALAPVTADGAALQVRPVLIDVATPGETSTITLKNLGSRPLNAQLRVYRWAQRNGTDQLTPTNDVVASPPFARLTSGADYVVRIVRVRRDPPRTEESYRLIIDQIPPPRKSSGVNVNFVMRYSIPVFFGSNRASNSDVTWAFHQHQGKAVLSAVNSGGRRMRVSGLTLTSANGNTLSFGKGLLGYVLGDSNAAWRINGTLRGARPGSVVTISAQGDNGPVRAKATVLPAQ